MKVQLFLIVMLYTSLSFAYDDFNNFDQKVYLQCKTTKNGAFLEMRYENWPNSPVNSGYYLNYFHPEEDTEIGTYVEQGCAVKNLTVEGTTISVTGNSPKCSAQVTLDKVTSKYHVQFESFPLLTNCKINRALPNLSKSVAEMWAAKFQFGPVTH